MKHRLQRNIVILFIVCSAVPLTVVAAIGYFSSTRAVESMMGSRSAFSCREIGKRFDREMRRLQNTLLFISTGLSRIPESSSARAYRADGRVEFEVSDLLLPGKYDSMFSGFVVLDGEGNPRYKINYLDGAVTTERGARYYLHADHFLPEDRLDGGRMAPPGGEGVRVLSPLPGEVTMTLKLLAPVLLEDRVAGFLVGTLDAGSLLESIIANISLGKETFYIVTDTRTRVVLFHPDPSKRNQLISVALPGLEEHLVNVPPGTGRRYRDPEGGLWILNSRRLSDTPWMVSIAAPLGIFLAPIDRVGLLSGLVVLSVLGAATLFLVLATRRFRRSLVSLTAAAERFSSGALDNRVRVESDDEMGALAATFNRMASELQATIGQREESARFDSFHRLSAAVAHDLKGSLFSLSLLLENMEQHLDNPEFLKDSAETLHGAVDKMKRTISKLGRETGRWKTRTERIALGSLLEKILKESGLSEHPSIRVMKDFDPAAEILGDPEETERLFLNLVHNAADAMQQGGVLKLSCGKNPAAGNSSPGVVAVVEDTGDGMAPEFVRDQLFRPFRSTKKGGIGLGLYTCREIVARQEGRIEVESEIGNGARFTVHFPAAPPGETGS